jgi:phosphoglycolate phosphatase-like HAD superfamily hydrolase
MKTIVVDLDGTLCDCAHRIAYAQSQQWDEFHSRLADDQPFLDVVEFIERIDGLCQFELVGLTGRSEKWRNLTNEWLSRHQIYLDVLLMRPDGNFESDHILKPKMLLEEIFNGDFTRMKEGVFLVLEDRDKVVEAWRNLTIPCWQVRNGTY